MQRRMALIGDGQVPDRDRSTGLAHDSAQNTAIQSSVESPAAQAIRKPMPCASGLGRRRFAGDIRSAIPKAVPSDAISLRPEACGRI
jgi:hypothetical protein